MRSTSMGSAPELGALFICFTAIYMVSYYLGSTEGEYVLSGLIPRRQPLLGTSQQQQVVAQVVDLIRREQGKIAVFASVRHVAYELAISLLILRKHNRLLPIMGGSSLTRQCVAFLDRLPMRTEQELERSARALAKALAPLLRSGEIIPVPGGRGLCIPGEGTIPRHSLFHKDHVR